MKYLEQLGEGKLLNNKQKVVDECMSMCYDKAQEQEDNTTLYIRTIWCNLGALLKNHETKIREEQEKTSDDSTCTVSTEEHRKYRKLFTIRF